LNTKQDTLIILSGFNEKDINNSIEQIKTTNYNSNVEPSLLPFVKASNLNAMFNKFSEDANKLAYNMEKTKYFLNYNNKEIDYE